MQMTNLAKFVSKLPKINILVLILILSFLVRIPRFDFPLTHGFAWGDGTRDFLVANHIVRFGEFPLVGPHNLLADSGIKNSSPIYFYLLAIPLFFYNNILTLSLINIFLQIILIGLIFFIVKNIFDQKTALIATLLYSFNWEVLHQADFIWQPNLMLPIMVLSSYFLILAYLKKDYLNLFYGVFLLVLAIVVHHSGFPWLPMFLMLTVILMKKMKTTFKAKIGLFIVFMFSVLVLYLPILAYILRNDLKFYTVNSTLTLANLEQYFSNFLANIEQVLLAIFPNYAFNTSLIFLSFLALIYFLKVKDKKKRLMFLLLIMAVLPIFFTSFFNKIRLHYLILSIPALVIFLSRLIAIQKNKALMQILILVFFILLTANLKFLNFPNLFSNQKNIMHVSKIIKEELTVIQKKDGYKDFSFFQISSYALDQTLFDYPVLDSVLIIPLEETLNQKLSTVSNESFFNHIQTGKKDYVLVVCHQFSNKFNNHDCLNAFVYHNPRHAILKNLYRSYAFSIYIAKKHE